MRISTSMMFNGGTLNMQQLQSGLYQLQNQMTAQKRILTPSDDPVAAAQAVVVSQNQAVNSMYINNQGNAGSQLALLDGQLGGITDLLTSVKEQVVTASSTGIGNAGRAAISANIKQRYNELMGLANSTDAMGQHLFSGFRGDTQPFAATGTPGSRTVSYSGDDGKRQLQVASGRLMDVSESGSDLFMRIPQGNGSFMFSAGTTNTGTGSIGASSTISGYDGSAYQLTFTAANAYTLVTTTNGVPTSTSGTYTAGNQIVLGGAGQQIQISISGAPAVGDTFTVAPSSNQDIFKTLDDMISALDSNVSASPASTAAFMNQMTNVSANLDQAFNKMLNARASVGTRQVELDSLTTVGNNVDLQYSTDLKNLQDFDYIKASSDLASQKLALEAAQLAFKQTSALSLFSIL